MHARRGLTLVLLALLALVPFGAANAAFSGRNGNIVFVRANDLWVEKTDGSEAQLTTDPLIVDAAPDWSPDGTKIVFSRAGALNTLTVSAADASVVSGPAPLATPTTGTNPDWSPDGTKIVYDDGVDVFVANADGGAQTNLTNSAGTVDKEPVWSPDGTKIAFASFRDGNFELYVMNADGTGQTRLTSSAGADERPEYAPSGATIAFQSNRDGTHQIYTVSSSGGAETRVTNTSTAETAPTWSPDGAKLAFARTTVASNGIYTMSTSGSIDAARTTGADTTPDWQTFVPANVTAPTVTSSTTPAQGTSVTASTGSWTGATSYEYQWLRCDANASGCSDIAGATSSSYTLASEDVGLTVKVKVRARNSAGASSYVESSNATGVVAGPGPVNTSPPTITVPSGLSAPKVGFTLTASVGTWTGSAPITYTYQWKKCELGNGPCFDLAGKTTASLTLTGDLIGWEIRVMVTATNSAGTRSQNSAPTVAVVGDLPKVSVRPQISGVNAVGQTLTVNTGTWTGTTPITYSYEWRRCDPFGTFTSCVPIAGATATSYVVRPADHGYTLRVFVTAKNAAGATTSFTDHTFPITPEQHFAPKSVAAPSITGEAAVGETLRLVIGQWSGDTPFRFAYRWQRCDATGSDCRTVRKQTRNRYTVTLADVGFTLRVAVVARNAIGTATAFSAATDTVSRPPKLPRGRTLYGGPDGDYIPGGGGHDRLYGRGGNDTLRGGAGNDLLDGGSGNDVIDAGPGSDRVRGGPGSDTIRAADGRVDRIDCGDGKDRVVADPDDRLVNCESVAAKPTGSGD